MFQLSRLITRWRQHTDVELFVSVGPTGGLFATRRYEFPGSVQVFESLSSLVLEISRRLTVDDRPLPSLVVIDGECDALNPQTINQLAQAIPVIVVRSPTMDDSLLREVRPVATILPPTTLPQQIYDLAERHATTTFIRRRRSRMDHRHAAAALLAAVLTFPALVDASHRPSPIHNKPTGFVTSRVTQPSAVPIATNYLVQDAWRLTLPSIDELGACLCFRPVVFERALHDPEATARIASWFNSAAWKSIRSSHSTALEQTNSSVRLAPPPTRLRTQLIERIDATLAPATRVKSTASPRWHWLERSLGSASVQDLFDFHRFLRSSTGLQLCYAVRAAVVSEST